MKSNDLRALVIFFLFLFSSISLAQSKELSFSEGLAAKKIYNKKEDTWKFGFVDEKERIRVKAEYDTVYHNFKEGIAIAGKNGYAGAIDSKGNQIVPFQHKEVAPHFSKKLIGVKDQQGLWGFYTRTGKKAVDFQYNNFRFRDRGRIIVQKNGRWGLIDSKGSELLPYEYRHLETAGDRKHFNGHPYNNWELKDRNNRTVGRFTYDSISAAGKGVLKYYMLGKFGLIDTSGNTITHYKYDSIGSEHHAKFIVKLNDKYGTIDRKGNEVLPASFTAIEIDSLYIRAAMVNDGGNTRWGLYSKTGNQLLPHNYPYLGRATGGLIPAQAENGLWRYVNLLGNTVIGFKYTEAGPFVDRAAVVTEYKSGKKAVIDGNGNYIIKPEEYRWYEGGLLKTYNGKKVKVFPFHLVDSVEVAGNGYYRAYMHGRCGLTDIRGTIKVPFEYDYASAPSGKGYIVVEKGGKWGVLDASGNFSLPLTSRFEKIYEYNDAYAKVKNKGNYGFIDPRGNIYISVQYPQAGEMSEGMVALMIKGKWGFTDQDEKLLVQPYYEKVWPFNNGIALVKEDGKYNMVNKQGKELHEPLDKIISTKGGYILVRGKKMGFAGKDGKEIIGIRYESIEDVGNGHLIIRNRELYGVTDYQHNIKIPFSYHYISYDHYNGYYLTGTVRVHEKLQVK